MSKKAGGGYGDRRSMSPTVNCFADEDPSWNSIANMTPDHVRYEAIIKKLKDSFGSDKETSKLYVDPVTFDDMFEKLAGCISDIDEAVKNHEYVTRDTKNIIFVRNIVLKQFNIIKVKKADQRLILFETAAIILLSMNKKLSNDYFPKYKTIESFLNKYPHYNDLSYDEQKQYMQFANYIVVSLKFMRGQNNEKHLIPIGLRIVAGKGEEFITGGGKTDKTKRRIEILKVEGGFLNERPESIIQIPWDRDPNIEDPDGFTNWLKEMIEDEHGFDFLDDNTYDREYPNPFAPNVIHRVNQRSTSDGSFNIEYHETRLDHGDESSTILSRSVSLIEKWRDGDDRFDEEIAGIEFLRLPSVSGGASITSNLARTNDYTVRTTSINLKNSCNLQATPGQKRNLDSNNKYEDQLPQVIRSISQQRHPDEIALMRSTSDIGDLVLNHLNMGSLTDDIMAISSMDMGTERSDSIEAYLSRTKAPRSDSLEAYISLKKPKDAESMTKEIQEDDEKL